MGARGQTDPAAHAFFILNSNRPCFILDNGPDGTDQKAFRLLAVPADRKKRFSLDPEANHIGSTWIIAPIPSLVADHLAGLAADALLLIYCYTVERFHDFNPTLQDHIIIPDTGVTVGANIRF
jgi:hypothetical protein